MHDTRNFLEIDIIPFPIFDSTDDTRQLINWFSPMKYFVLPFLFISVYSFGQDVTGQWKTLDDKTGKERSVVEVYLKNGKLYGKVVKIFAQPGEKPDPVCEECDESDDRFQKRVLGMEIIRHMVKTTEGSYEEGNILDPEIGKVYRCKLWMEDGNLMVRGYWGPFFRTQVWTRVN